jgi:uncharacterized protein (TIGR03437 family)
LAIFAIAQGIFPQVQTGQLKPFFTASSVLTASAVDAEGNLYIAGLTVSDDIPVTTGAFQTQFPACTMPGCQHSFVAKIAPNGKQLLFATYFGGNGSDSIRAITLDPTGNVYLAGATTSTNLPVKAGAYQVQPGDAFIAELSADGRSLLALTYLSGGQTQGLTLDSTGNVYVVGGTTSLPFKTTAGAFQTVNQGGVDAFVIKLDSPLANARYSTLIGGSFDDIAWAIAVNGNGEVYITGGTTSTPADAPNYHGGAYESFPLTSGAVIQPSPIGGLDDVFILKLTADGSALIYSALLGGSSIDVGMALTIDNSGAAYVAGTSPSKDFPLSDSPFQVTGGQFALKLSPDGSKLLYSTHLPGPFSPSEPRLFQIALDASGNLLIHSAADDLVATTPDSFQPCAASGTASYVLQLNADGSARNYGSYVLQEVAIRADGHVWYADPSGNIEDFNIRDPLPAGPRCVANAWTYRTGAVAPGEFVSLFGPAIGPDQPAYEQLDASGNVSTSIGGVSVFVNGIAAPLLYASRSQINAIVPFEMAGTKAASVLVMKNGNVLQEIDVPTALVAPTIATTSEGCAAAVNPDGTVNSSGHPALLGSTVSLYGFGAGLMTPSATNGSFGDGTHLIQAPVSAQVLVPGFPGPMLTAPANILYAGDAPGEVQGVFQINITLPDSFAMGKQGLHVLIGDVSSGGMCLWISSRVLN